MAKYRVNAGYFTVIIKKRLETTLMDGYETSVKPQAFQLKPLYRSVGYQVKLGKKRVELTLKDLIYCTFLPVISGKW